MSVPDRANNRAYHKFHRSVEMTRNARIEPAHAFIWSATGLNQPMSALGQKPTSTHSSSPVSHNASSRRASSSG